MKILKNPNILKVLRTWKYLVVLFFGLSASVRVMAQTEEGNIMVGAQLLNVTGTFQSGSSTFDMGISPQVGFFLSDNFALGAAVLANLRTASHYTDFSYAVGPFARYYFNHFKGEDLQFSKRSSFFVEGDVFVQGENIKTNGNSVNTNGLGIGIGPGIAYFITPSIGLEALLKYNPVIGFGNSTTVNKVSLNLGLQAYLPGSHAKRLIQEEKNNH